jgi:hypothetical protein
VRQVGLGVHASQLYDSDGLTRPGAGRKLIQGRKLHGGEGRGNVCGGVRLEDRVVLGLGPQRGAVAQLGTRGPVVWENGQHVFRGVAQRFLYAGHVLGQVPLLGHVEPAAGQFDHPPTPADQSGGHQVRVPVVACHRPAGSFHGLGAGTHRVT